MINDTQANQELTKALDLARTPHGTVDNVMRVHSLRPSTLKGHLTLYRSVLHDKENTIPAWFQETISSYVSLINKCEYSFSNHWANACFLISNKSKSDSIEKALKSGKISTAFKGSELKLLEYARKLTLHPSKMVQNDIKKLKSAGIPDAEILEANQIICYFNYVNRTINGLGVTTDGDIVGYYK
jgi:uncharacterized peroxidase-related enzyme